MDTLKQTALACLAGINAGIFFLLGWARKEYTSFSFVISARNVTIKNFVQNGGGVSTHNGNA